jgi:hypothetical protein
VSLLTVMALVPSLVPGATRIPHNPYTLTVSKNSSGGFVIAGKPPGTPPLFKLDYYGMASFNIINDTDDRVDFRMSDFTHSGPRGCPLEFLAHGNSQTCSAIVMLRDRGDSKVVFVIAGDTDPDRKERFKFNTKINGDIIDPEIEIDRENVRNWLKYWQWLLSGGTLSLLVGWWLGRRH